MAVWIPVVVAFIAALATLAGTLYATRKQRSGEIRTTEAETLWAAAEQLREDYRNELASVRAELATVRVEVTRLQGEVATWMEKASRLQQEAATWQTAHGDGN